VVANNNIKDAIKLNRKRCEEDPEFFIKKFCLIQHPKRGRVYFELYSFQEDVLRDLIKHEYNIVLKSRQLGLSTLAAAYALWMMMFKRDSSVMAIATKKDTARNIIKKVQFMHSNLPSWLKEAEIEDNKLSLTFENGSNIRAISSKPDSSRSEALSLLIVDEAAFIDNIEETMTAAWMTLATGGSCLMLSTPNGASGYFYKTWVKSTTETNSSDADVLFNPIKLKWDVHPERDQKWRDKQDRLLGPKMAAQECDADFVTSGDTVIQGTDIDYYEKTTVCDPLEKRGVNRALWIWQYADSNLSYIITGDVARGDGSDYCAAHVFRLDNLEQVAEFKEKVDPKTFGDVLVSMGTDYNNALVVVDNSNVGWSTIQQLIDRSYDNLFYSNSNLTIVDTKTQLDIGYDLKPDHKLIAGMSMNSITRPLLISKLEIMCREQVPIIKSIRTIAEMKTFIWNGSRAEARRGENDDLIMALAMAFWVRDTAIKLRTLGYDMTTSILSSMTGVAPIFTGKDAMPKEVKESWTMNVGSAESFDLTSLIRK